MFVRPYRTPDTEVAVPDKVGQQTDISSRLIQHSLIGPDDPAYFTGYRTPDIRGALFTQQVPPERFEHPGDVTDLATRGYTDVHGLVTYPLSSSGVANVSSVKPTAKRNYDSFNPSQQAYLKRQKRYAYETPTPETQGEQYTAFPYEYRDAPSGPQWPDTVPRVLEADGSITHDRRIIPSRVPGDSDDSSSAESAYQDSDPPGSEPMVHPETQPPSSEIEEGGLGTDDESVTFQKAVNEVYRLLPRDICPQGNLPTPRLPKRTGSMDVLEESVPVHGLEVLPHSVCVGDTVDFLQRDTSEQRAVTGFQTAAIDVKRLTRSASYRVHTPSFTSSAPPMEADASNCDLKEGSSVSISVETLKKWETRVRALADAASYLELFNAASYNLQLSAGTEKSFSNTNLLKAKGSAARHSIAGAVSLAADIMQLRRDAALATSKQLSVASKGILRSSPLGTDKLFAGIIPQVLELNKAEQERTALHRAMAPRAKVQFKPVKPEGGTPSKKKSHRSKKGKKAIPPPPVQPNRGRGDRGSSSAGRGRAPTRGYTRPGRGRGRPY